MRDLVFKNLTSSDKKRKIISSMEVMDKEGVHSIIRRHFLYLVREVASGKDEQALPTIYVLRERDRKNQSEKFFCKLKGSICILNQGKYFMVTYMHSLMISLSPKTLAC